MSLVANANESSFDEKANRSLMSNYHVGEVDENGFVCIGIAERKVRGSGDLDRGATGQRPVSGGMYSDNCSDYSSAEEYSSMDAKSHSSRYKQSLDFLVGQGVRVKEIPKNSN